MNKLVIETEEDWIRLEEIIRAKVRKEISDESIWPTTAYYKQQPKGYTSWASMKARCYNKKHGHYRDYGGRGIQVCMRWHKFENFLADMGQRPEGMSIERIDVDGDYEPSNCRWATKLDQMRNTRRSVQYKSMYGTNTIRELSEKSGVGEPALRYRLKSGWDLERALTTKTKGKTKC